MAVQYDKYYETENLFGAPYPELIEFYSQVKEKGKLLDLGCGQGRDALPLARMGFVVTGIDHSKKGIDQLNKKARIEDLSLIGEVNDIYTFSKFDEFDFILLDSIFHFGKKERLKELQLLTNILDKSNSHTLITICIQNSGNKIQILKDHLSSRNDIKLLNEVELFYTYVDQSQDHRSETKYTMLTIEI